jgi:hypothetical protein
MNSKYYSSKIIAHHCLIILPLVFFLTIMLVFMPFVQVKAETDDTWIVPETITAGGYHTGWNSDMLGEKQLWPGVSSNWHFCPGQRWFVSYMWYQKQRSNCLLGS